MKKHSKLFQIFIIFTSFLFVMFLSCNVVKAEYYQESSNKLTGFSVDKYNDKVTLSFEYQNGIKDIKVYICNPGDCAYSTDKALTAFEAKYKNSENQEVWITSINSSNGLDTFTYTLDASKIVSGISLSAYSERYTEYGKVDNKYEILVKARFCIMRDLNHTDCNKWDEDLTDFNGPKSFDMQTGLTNSGEINNTIGQILVIINNIVIPALWVVLGVLLIVRGIILGIGIVKSSDEPDVRKKKISGLIWLGIGIGVTYVVTIAASAVMSMLGYGGYF